MSRCELKHYVGKALMKVPGGKECCAQQNLVKRVHGRGIPPRTPYKTSGFTNKILYEEFGQDTRPLYRYMEGRAGKT